METAVHSGRREERAPLDALIELRSDDSAEVLEADGLDLSPGGLAMRAAFVPPVGARLQCQFRCSPDGERVRVEGEVVWAHWQSDRDGAFGMRFLELDTKSATAIRRHMEPELSALEAQVEPPAPTLTDLRIDGVGAPIETEVLFADSGSIVVEQELNFLKLGRGVSIDVPGVGAKRGRIGSVELRHGPLDVPTLVFGILLDSEPEPREFAVGVSEARLTRELALEAHAAREPAIDAREPVVEARSDVREGGRREEPQIVSIAAVAAPTAPASAPTRPDSGATTRAPSETCAPTSVRSASEVDEADLKAMQPSLVAHTRALAGAIAAWWSLLWSRVAPLFKGAIGGVRGQTAQLREAHWPEAKSKLAVHFARARLLVASQRAWFARLRKLRKAKTRSTSPAPRVQRSSVAAPRHTEAAAPISRGHASRWLGIGLAVAGVALGVYALAPRSGADRIRVRRPVVDVESAPEAPAESLALEQAPAASPEVAAPAVPEPEQSTEEAATLSFGESSVPNGRTFSLRMSGPVQSVEGERREDGFTVRIPGRLALDRASPIATSHRAVARAMILNRGDYAELTVDFLPGLRPKYQVVGKDAAIEVTLERI